MVQPFIAACVLLMTILHSGAQQDKAAQAYLNAFNAQLEELQHKSHLASWDYYTNITGYNKNLLTKRNLELARFHKEQIRNASQFDLEQINDPLVIRQLKKILDVGIGGLADTNIIKRIHDLEAEMTGIYSSAKWKNKSLEPDLVDILTNSRDSNELKNVWKGWRDVSGRKMKKQYEELVNLLNAGIKAGGKYADIGEYFRSWYEDPSFETNVGKLYEELRPLYTHLHAYVRRKLREFYKNETFPSSGHIPAHLLGNMWAQQWNSIYNILEPYPGLGRKSLTEEMKSQNYNVTHMYRVAEDFFTSIGLQPLPASFWTKSMLEKPTDGRDVVCHASALDLCNGTDFRIKQCTTVTEDQLLTVHHEMGHVQYFMEYKDQPTLFRGGANPGFHEGVADIVGLSFQTPQHLKEIGLLSQLPNGTEADINFLLQMALEKVAFLPFGYLVDQWRWSVFRGDTTPNLYNRNWWKLRCKYQGISPPVARSDDDFDPGAKFHIAQDTPYIRQMLRMGASEPWEAAMKTITRGTPGETDKMSTAPLLEYFNPLLEWLRIENNRTGENLSWKDTCPDGSFISDFSSRGSALLSFSGLLLPIVTMITFYMGAFISLCTLTLVAITLLIGVQLSR